MRKIYTAFALVPLVLLVSAVMVLGAAQLAYPDGYPDPFAPYEVIMPGQPYTVLEEYPCSYVYDPVGEPDCVLVLDADHFRSIIVYYYQGTIQQLSFVGNELYVTDLVLRWKYPDIVRHERNGSFYLRLSDTVVALTEPITRFSYRAVVQSISIRRY